LGRQKWQGHAICNKNSVLPFGTWIASLADLVSMFHGSGEATILLFHTSRRENGSYFLL
jgi:hypothetical protein